MKYAVDRIENDIAVCENLDTKEMIELNINMLPDDVKDGSIIVYENGKYGLDLSLEEERKKQIQEKFDRLRKRDV